MSVDELIWLTYSDAAERMSIKPDSVRRRAAARKWPRRLGNDGRASVGIPRSVLPGLTHDDPDHNPGLSAELASAKTEIRLLREQLEDARKDRDAWHAQVERLASSHTEARPTVGLFARLFGR